MTAVCLTKLKLPLTLIILQAVFIFLFSTFVDYDDSARPTMIERLGSFNYSFRISSNTSNRTASSVDTSQGMSVEDEVQQTDRNLVRKYYPMFQDVHVMIFVGFGFLMMFLRRYGFSSVGLNMLLSAIAIQWATLVGGLLHHHGSKFTVSVTSMLTADFACATVLITFGALLGKTSPMQMVVITMVEITLFSANEYLGVVILKVVDVGGSIFVHAFGAYFGLALSRVLYTDDVQKSNKEGSIYHSDMFAVIGSLFLWMFWPSFNSALAVDDGQNRALLNTYFALAACCLVSFAISSLFDKDGRFDMVHIQNATLAGGVAVGTTADMMIRPYGTLLIGSISATLSVIGYKYITPFLSSKLKIHDTCGVNNLHGMPAIMAGLTSAIVVNMADTQTYGYTLYRQFPAMAPKADSLEWVELKSHIEYAPSEGRSASQQACFQAIAVAITVGVAIVGGALTGLVLRLLPFLGRPTGERLFDDSPYWHVPEETNDITPVVTSVIAQLQSKKTTPKKHLDESHFPLL